MNEVTQESILKAAIREFFYQYSSSRPCINEKFFIVRETYLENGDIIQDAIDLQPEYSDDYCI